MPESSATQASSGYELPMLIIAISQMAAQCDVEKTSWLYAKYSAFWESFKRCNEYRLPSVVETRMQVSLSHFARVNGSSRTVSAT